MVDAGAAKVKVAVLFDSFEETVGWFVLDNEPNENPDVVVDVGAAKLVD